MPSIIYLCINLPWADDRRRSIEEQAVRHGIDIQFVEAVAGKNISAEEMARVYDHEKRLSAYPKDLLPNEVACSLSHRKAIKTFLESGAEYAVIMEDDALLADNFKEGLDELINHLHGWEIAKLYTDDGKLYPLTKQAFEGAPIQPVMPKKLPWVLVGMLYTRRGAELLYPQHHPIWLESDPQLFRPILESQIPTIGVSPSLIVTSDPNNENSTLDSGGMRTQKGARRGLLTYLRYRLHVLRMSINKARMRRLMERRLKRS